MAHSHGDDILEPYGFSGEDCTIRAGFRGLGVLGFKIICARSHKLGFWQHRTLTLTGFY